MSQGAPPAAPRRSREIRTHGVLRDDPYAWMRDRDDPEVLRYLEQENRYAAEAIGDTSALEKLLYEEMLGRIKQTDLSVPVRLDDHYYYSRTAEGLQYPVQCRRRGSLDAPEEVLLDQNELARGMPYFRLGAFRVSPDHGSLAYSTDVTGGETYTMRIKDLSTGALLDDLIEGCHASVEWSADGQWIFYTTLNAAHRPYRLFRHRVGSPASSDTLVHEEGDEAYFLSAHKSKDRKYILVGSHSQVTSEVRLFPAAEPESTPELVRPRRHGVEYHLEHHGGRFFVLTNDDGATNFKIMEAPESAPADWKEWLGHDPEVHIDGLDVFEGYLAVFQRRKGLPQLRVIDLSGQGSHEVAFDEPAYALWRGANPNFKERSIRFGYSSLVTPASIYEYRMDTRQRTLLKRTDVLGGYDPALYGSARLHARSHDGVEVPISLVWRRSCREPGAPMPCLLYGYGSYGIPIDADFSSGRLSLLDRGFLFAIAHIRGGGDLGRAWYDDGKLLKKQNTFLDFEACAEYLIHEGWTTAGQLAIYGGSAGGLLVGAVVNRRPELFAAAVAKVPFVDSLNTMLDPTLPLTVVEYDEWGNPEQKEYFDCMRAYSPYENVKAQDYPAMLVTAGLNDPRVNYWEPAKWVARLRSIKTDKRPLLLKTNMGAGHGGASGRYDALRETAFEYAFLLKVLGRAEGAV